jgi:hypothetical protein
MKSKKISAQKSAAPSAVEAVKVSIQVEYTQGTPARLKPLGPIRLPADQQLVWVCPEGHLEIRLAPRFSPFLGHRYETGPGRRCFSGPLKNPAAGPRGFTFTAIVTTARGTQVTPAQAGYLLTREFTVEITGLPAAKQGEEESGQTPAAGEQTEGAPA